MARATLCRENHSPKAFALATTLKEAVNIRSRRARSRAGRRENPDWHIGKLAGRIFSKRAVATPVFHAKPKRTPAARRCGDDDRGAHIVAPHAVANVRTRSVARNLGKPGTTREGDQWRSVGVRIPVRNCGGSSRP